MPSVDIKDVPRSLIKLGKKRSSKAHSALAVRARILIHARHHFRERHAASRQRPQTSLKSSHYHRRRNALARHVGHHKQYPARSGFRPRPQDHIVVIPRHRVCRTRSIRNLVSRNLQRRTRQHPRLNVFGDFQVALHHHAIRQFQQQHRQQQQPAPNVFVKYKES